MRLIWRSFIFVFLFGFNAFAARDIDCKVPNACIQTEEPLEFGKLEIRSTKEEWKTYSWGEAYREVTLTINGYFPTLLAGKPIVGQDSQEGGKILFVLGPVSDLDAPSDVTNEFVVRGGKEKIRIYSYQGNLQDKKTVFLGEF